MRKKTFLVLLISFLFVGGLIAPKNTFAQSKWWDQDFETFKNKVNGEAGVSDNEIFGERYTAAQVNWILNSLALAQEGLIGKCLTANPPGGSLEKCFQDVKNGAGAMGSPVMFLANLNDALLSAHPASGINYVANKIQKVNPIQTAHAQQGFGYTTLQPLQTIWLAIRNMSFGLMSFVIIILAFMIMFRQKISAQAVITAQSALPKVVIALIFITFSYAIAGLLVDLSYVVLGVLSLVVSSSGLSASQDVISMFNHINNPNEAFAAWTLLLSGIMTAGGIIGFATGGLGIAVGAVSGLIAVILLALCLVAFFRIFVTSLKAFATVVFLIIGSPLIGLGSVISIGPGIGGWVKQMAAQLSVFVAIAAAMMLSHLIFFTMAVPGGWLSDAIFSQANFYGFKIGEIGTQNAILLPGYGGFPIQIIAFFLGFGILFSAPKIATGLRDQIATGRSSYGLDTWGMMAGPVAGVTAAAYAGSKKYGTGIASTAFQNSRLGADFRDRASQLGNNISNVFGGSKKGNTTAASQNANDSIKANRDSGNNPLDNM